MSISTTFPPETTVSSAPNSLAVVLEQAESRLARARVPSPVADAELLVGHVLGLSRGAVLARAFAGATVNLEDVLEIDALVERRCAREPLQHITGVAYFRSLELGVGPGAFVPRPETEGVAQLAIDALAASASPSPLAVDLGTGSGAIALALASEVPHARVVGVEVSPHAFIWARENLRRVGVDNARIVCADLADALPELDGTVDVVVSNPPYIPEGAIPRDPEVRLHDPELALYGGADGLDIVRDLSRTALRLLHAGGMLVIEHGELQAQSVAELLTGDGWTAIATHRDLTGRDRSTTALRP